MQTMAARQSFRHRWSDPHHAVVAGQMADTIASWLRQQNLTWYRPHDLPRLVLSAEAEHCTDPDRDFLASPGDALERTRANIALLEVAARSAERSATINHWTYDPRAHARLVLASAAERAIKIWMHRVITVRADVPVAGR